jgi:hypothetical protein
VKSHPDPNLRDRRAPTSGAGARSLAAFLTRRARRATRAPGAPNGLDTILSGEDLTRDIRHRTRDKAVATTYGVQTPLIAVVGMNEL